jgi:hypothetical protein
MKQYGLLCLLRCHLRAIEFDRESTGDIRTNYSRPN